MTRTRRAGSRQLSIAVAVVMACTVSTMAGCSDGDSEGSAEVIAGSAAKRVDPVESGMPANPTPGRGGQLVYALEAESEGGWCLPEAQLAASGLQVVRSIYDHLTVPDGKGGYAPYLARSIDPDDSYTTWTIKLRPGVVFHNDEPLTSDLVKLNLDTYRGAIEDGPRNVTLFYFALGNIADIERVDELTLRVHLTVAQPAFPGLLYSSGRLAILAAEQLNAPKEACDQTPIGSGPFRFIDWAPNDHLKLRRWDKYWLQAPDGQPYPYLDGIEYVPMPDGNARIAALQSGDINMMHTSAAADMAGSLAQLRDEGAINLLVSEEQTEVTYGIANTSVPGLDNRDTRIAIAQALDRDRLNLEANAGYSTVANGPFAPGVIGHLEDSGFPEHDLEAAKATVARLKAEGRPTSFEFLTTVSPANVRAAVIAQEMLKAAGFDIRLEVVPEAELIERVIGGDYEISAFRNQPGDDPDMNYVWWYGDGNPVNFGRFDDPEINKQLDIGRSSLDPDERKAAYEALNRRFADQAYMSWLYFALWAVAESPNVHGILGPPLDPETPAPPRLVTGHPVTGIWIEPREAR